MPDPIKLLRTIDLAIEAMHRTPGRTGRLIEPVDADDLLIVGDLHGHISHFQTILKIADLANNPRRHLVLQELIHGKFRYPGGGDKSHQLLDLCCALTNLFPKRVHLLMGNHELSQWTDHPIMKGHEHLNDLFLAGIEEAYGDQAQAITAAYSRFFAAMPIAVRTANRVFLSHSLPTPKSLADFSLDLLTHDELPAEAFESKGPIYRLVWGRDVSEENAAAFLEKVDADWLVTGHIPCEQGFAIPNSRQVIIDSCAMPAAYMLFPTTGSMTADQFRSSVHHL